MTPKKLRIRNYTSHEDSVIDFDRFDSALMIGMNNDSMDSSNGAGKSSVIESMGWCLFGKSKHQRVDDVVRYGEEQVRVDYEFSGTDGNRYLVTRRRRKAGSEELFLIRNDEDISGSTVADTKKLIEGIINFDYDLFVNSVFLEQGDVTRFAAVAPAKRKEIVKSILGLAKWDLYEKEAKSRHKESDRLLADYEKKYDRQEIVSEIRTSSKELVALRMKKHSFESKLLMIESSLATRDIADAVLLDKRKKELKNNLSSVASTGKSKKRKFDETRERIRSVSEAIKSSKLVKEPANPNIEQKIDSLIKRKTEANKRLAATLSEAKLIKFVKYGKCFACGSVIDEETAQKMNDEGLTRKDKLQHESERLRGIIAELDGVIKQAKEAASEYELLRSKYDRAQERIKSNGEILKNLRETESELKEELIKLRSDAESLRSSLDSLEANDSDSVIAQKKKADDVKKQIESLSFKIGAATERRNAGISKYKDYLSDLDEINKLKKESLLYDQLRWAFGKKGIQAVIMSKVIAELEARSNEVLDIICGDEKKMSISIDTQRKKPDGSVVETFDINVYIGPRISSFDSLSGGERVRIAFALRIGLSQILSARRGGKIGVLLLDEICGALDEVGIKSFTRVIRFLESKFDKILVVTHRDDMKDAFSNRILVKNDFGVSKVYQA
jgi:exonuclease SbcC